MILLSEALGFRMVGLLDHPGIRLVVLKVSPGFRIVGLLVTPLFLFGWTLRGLPVLVWLDFQRPPGFRIVGLSEALRCSYD